MLQFSSQEWIANALPWTKHGSYMGHSLGQNKEDLIQHKSRICSISAYNTTRQTRQGREVLPQYFWWLLSKYKKALIHDDLYWLLLWLAKYNPDLTHWGHAGLGQSHSSTSPKSNFSQPPAMSHFPSISASCTSIQLSFLNQPSFTWTLGEMSRFQGVHSTTQSGMLSL